MKSANTSFVNITFSPLFFFRSNYTRNVEENNLTKKQKDVEIQVIQHMDQLENLQRRKYCRDYHIKLQKEPQTNLTCIRTCSP